MFWVTVSSCKRFLHTCRYEHASEAPGGFQTHKPQEYLWFSPAAQSDLCVPPGKLHFLFSQLTQQKKKNQKAKIASISPQGLDSSALAYTSTFLPAAGWETERQAYGMCRHSQARWAPLRFMILRPASPTLSTLHWVKRAPGFLK